MESDIFIPEWFGIYATSNDKHKPSGPLGRRFNSVYLNYLDKENLARYVAAKLVNPNLTHPFSTQELEQIIKAIEIIYQASTKDDYSLLDFSIRMIDNFINGFTKLRSNKRVEKLDASSNSSTYILAALKNAFSVQIEDVYGIKEIGSSAVDVGEQSTAIAEIIDTAIEDFSGKISTPKRLVKKSTDKQALFMKKIDPDNPVLAIIIEEIRKNSKNTYENPSIMHYGSQIGAAINDIDRPLQKQYNIDMLPFDIDDPIDELNLESENPFYKISMDKQDMSLDVHTNQERNTYVARNVYKNADSSEILIDSIQ